MKKHVLLTIAICGGSLFAADSLAAQTVDEVSETEGVIVTDTPCITRYYNSWRDGWFLQLGAGIDMPVMEGFRYYKKEYTATYNLAVGRWFSPYFGFRFSGYYNAAHERVAEDQILRWRSASLNADVMWDICNSIGGVNLSRPVSIVPFVGIGATYNWRFRPADFGNSFADGKHRKNTWATPVSAGLQFRFRLCKYVDFFLEGRAQVAGDNYNNYINDLPVDINFTATGGFTINFGGRSFQTYDPCEYQAYIAALNGQVNDLRGELATTAAALATAEAQLPCPEPVVTEAPAPAPAPMLTTVRFTINSAKISSVEMVNVYNIAEYMKANPDTKVTITGYADKDTGTSAYNEQLSERRAQAVYDMLTKTYGIAANRLAIAAKGSAVQPYGTNDWNRIVIFTQD